MKKSGLFFAAVCAFGAVGCLCRVRMLERAFDAEGLPVFDVSVLILAVLCAAALAFFALAVRRLAPMPEFCGAFPPSAVRCAVGFAAAALFLAGNALTFLSAADRLTRIASAVSVLGGAFWIAVLGAMQRGKTPNAFLQFPAIVGMIVLYILQYRTWSISPVIGEYCFRMFGALFTLLGLFYLSGFPMGLGKRRMTLFFAAAATFFFLVSLPDAPLPSRLSDVGAAAFLLTFSVPLARK